jgi:hypothetical protein
MNAASRVLCGAILCLPALVHAAVDADDVMRCMQHNVVEQGALRALEVTTTDAAGKSSTLGLNMFWHGDRDDARVTLQVSEPESLAGSAYLIQENGDAADALFVYLPAVGKVRQISGAARGEDLWGTTFSYEDFKLVQGLLIDGAARKSADARVADRPTHVLETALGRVDSSFSRVVAYVDKQSCTVLKAEFFDREGKPSKLLEGDVSLLFETADAKDRKVWVLLGYTMKDLRTGTRSVVELGDIHLMKESPAQLFEPGGFFKAADAAP